MVTRIVLLFVILYQKTISPDHSFWSAFFPSFIKCRSYPSCSEYFKQIIEKEGVLRACASILPHIIKCRP